MSESSRVAQLPSVHLTMIISLMILLRHAADANPGTNGRV